MGKSRKRDTYLDQDDVDYEYDVPYDMKYRPSRWDDERYKVKTKRRKDKRKETIDHLEDE